MSKPDFKHPVSTSEGRVERAVWTLRDGERQGFLVAAVMEYLSRKGCTETEILEALNQASDGALVGE